MLIKKRDAFKRNFIFAKVIVFLNDIDIGENKILGGIISDESPYHLTEKAYFIG